MKTGDARETKGSKGETKPSRSETKRAHRKTIERFARSRVAESDYAKRLRQVARAVGHIVEGFAPAGIIGAHLEALTTALAKYGAIIEPWARAVAARMLADVATRDEKAWHQTGQEIGKALRAEIRGADTGALMRRLQAEQVTLIKSLPLEAAQRVHELARAGLASGRRPKIIAEKIARTGRVTMSRATLIARTEVARAASLMTQARAMHIGSEGYRWRTARDADVRPEHRRLEGKFVKWGQPPVAGRGKGGTAVHAHAGQFPNCRCWMEPVLPDLF